MFSILATVELQKIINKKEINIPLYFLIIINVLFVSNITILLEPDIKFNLILILSYLILVSFISFIFSLFQKNNKSIEFIGAVVFSFIYISFGFSSLYLIRELFDQGLELLLTILFSIWICDSAAYFTGKYFGKNKLWERISPKKTWEGAIGGFIASIITFFAFFKIFELELEVFYVLLIGLFIGVFGQVGDLFESKLKRDVQIKDSSNMFPGHGGVLDRFDSLIFVSPFILIILILIKF